MLGDVIDDYVSIERAEKDYSVVIEAIDPDRCEHDIDHEATENQREYIRNNREEWLREDLEDVVARYRSGELSKIDLIRRYEVILDWSTTELLHQITEQFREMLEYRAESD